MASLDPTPTSTPTGSSSSSGAPTLKFPILNLSLFQPSSEFGILSTTNGFCANVYELEPENAASASKLVSTTKPSINVNTGSSVGSEQIEQKISSLKPDVIKNKLVRLVSSGSAPKIGSEESEAELVVASVTEDKCLTLSRVEGQEDKAAEPIYTRTLIKKAATLSVESTSANIAAGSGSGSATAGQGTVIVADKVGDLFEYPLVSDSAASGTDAAQEKPRPDAVALAGDPSLNPDAELLVGHVSTLTAHLMTPDRKYLISADRDEHIRISRYPNCYNVEIYLMEHESFVSALCIPPSHPNILLSAGGDPFICIWDLATFTLLHKIAIGDAIKPYRRVRGPMRRIPVNMIKGGPAFSPASGSIQESEIKTKGMTSEEFDKPVQGWMIPMGEGIAVSRLVVTPGGQIVFSSQGSSAVFSFDLESALTGSTKINVHALDSPVLDFTLLPSPASAVASSDSAAATSSKILVSTDPAWEHRVDGAPTFFPPQVTNLSVGKKGRGKAKANAKAKAAATATAGESVEGTTPDLDTEMEADVAEEVAVKYSGWKEEDLAAMKRNGLAILAVHREKIEDVSETQRQLLDLIYSSTGELPVEMILAIPVYSDLMLLPRYPGYEGEEGGEEESAKPQTSSPAPIVGDGEKLSHYQKRQMGRLRAQGADVKIPLTDSERLRRSEYQRDRKKRKREEKKQTKKQGGAKGNKDDEDKEVSVADNVEAEMNEA